MKILKMVRAFYILIFILFLSKASYAQVDQDFYEKLESIDDKIDNWQHNEAKKLLMKLEKNADTLNRIERFALELRRFKAEYFIDDNNSNFGVILRRIDKLKGMNAPKVEYDYLSFAGEVYKISKNFEPAFYYHKKALVNAEKRKDTVDIIFSNWVLGNFYYYFEYYDPKFTKNSLDSTIYYYNRALKFPKNVKTNKWFARIYNNLGRIEADKGVLKKAKKNISKALSLHIINKDSFGIAISYNNLSRIYFLEKKYNKAISVAQKSNNYIKNKSQRIKRNNYEDIAKAYSKLGLFNLAYDNMKKTYEISEELHTNTLKKNENKAGVRYKIVKEQQKTLKEKNRRLQVQFLLYVFISLALVSTIIGFNLYSKNKHNKKIFENLISKTQGNNKIKKQSKVLKIPEKTINKIIKGIEQFEKTQGFLSKEITLNLLSTKLNTNSKYLSYIINSHKNKSFSSYLNDLRIDYVVKKLQIDYTLRNFTIEAISDHIGFGNSSSFVAAFRKRTGLNPSYFIKKLKKK